MLAYLAGGAAAARATGGLLTPVKESYQPGDVATLVGYTGGPTVLSVPTRPFYAYLHPAAGAPDVALGRLAVRETGHRGFLALRASITFDVPADLQAGVYVVRYCDDPCTGVTIGDLGPSPLSIGVAPARPVVRTWAFDDPEVANLAPEAVIAGADFQATAADVRAALVAPPPEPPLPTTLSPAPPDQAPEPAPAPATDWTGAITVVLAAAALAGLLLARTEWRAAAEAGAATRRRWEAPAGRTAADAGE